MPRWRIGALALLSVFVVAILVWWNWPEVAARVRLATHETEYSQAAGWVLASSARPGIGELRSVPLPQKWRAPSFGRAWRLSSNHDDFVCFETDNRTFYAHVLVFSADGAKPPVVSDDASALGHGWWLGVLDGAAMESGFIGHSRSP